MANWYLSPTGSDSNSGHTDNPTTGAKKTSAGLISAGFVTGDRLFLYPYATVGAYTNANTGRINFPGYGGSDYVSGVSNGIGRDINNGIIEGRGSLLTTTLATTQNTTEQAISIAGTNWTVRNLTISQTGTNNDGIENFALFMGPSGTIVDCTIFAAGTCTAWGSPTATTANGDNYPATDPQQIRNCVMYSGIAVIDAGGQTGTLLVEDTIAEVAKTPGFGVGFLLSNGPNIFRRCHIRIVGALGDSAQHPGIVFVSGVSLADEVPGVDLTVEECSIRLAGRTSQAYCRVMGYGGHKFGNVVFRNTPVFAPEDCESDVTFNSFTAINSPFFTDPYGSNGPRKTWSSTHLPRIKYPLLETA
jgi:hypothetical protein